MKCHDAVALACRLLMAVPIVGYAMASKYCPACLGTGSYLGTKWVRGESLDYQRVTVRIRCEFCNSAGPGHKAEICDGLYRWLLALTLLGYTGFQLYRDQSGPQEWLRVAAALLATFFLLFIFGESVGSARILRWTTLLLLVSAMLTDVTLHLVHF